MPINMKIKLVLIEHLIHQCKTSNMQNDIWTNLKFVWNFLNNVIDNYKMFKDIQFLLEEEELYFILENVKSATFVFDCLLMENVQHFHLKLHNKSKNITYQFRLTATKEKICLASYIKYHKDQIVKMNFPKIEYHNNMLHNY